MRLNFKMVEEENAERRKMLMIGGGGRGNGHFPILKYCKMVQEEIEKKMLMRGRGRRGRQSFILPFLKHCILSFLLKENTFRRQVGCCCQEWFMTLHQLCYCTCLKKFSVFDIQFEIACHFLRSSCNLLGNKHALLSYHFSS